VPTNPFAIAAINLDTKRFKSSDWQWLMANDATWLGPQPAGPIFFSPPARLHMRADRAINRRERPVRIAGRVRECSVPQTIRTLCCNAHRPPPRDTTRSCQMLTYSPHPVGLQNRVDHLLRRRRESILTAESDHFACEPVQFETVASVEVVRH
jgi:hypothetical protein